MFEPSARLGESTGLSSLGFPSGKETVHRRRADLHELFIGFRANLKSTRFVEPGQLDVHCRPQQLGTNAIEQISEKEEVRDQPSAILGAARMADDMLHIVLSASKQCDGILAPIACSTTIIRLCWAFLCQVGARAANGER